MFIKRALFLFFTLLTSLIQADAPWSTPELLDNAGQSPKVSMNNSDNAIIVWMDETDIGDIKGAFFNGTSGTYMFFSAPISNGGGASNPSVSMNNLGQAWASWTQANQIKVSHYDGTNWDTPVALTSSSTNDNSIVKLNDDNLAVLVYTGNTLAITTVNAFIFSGGNWSASTLLSDPTEVTTSTQVSLNNLGTNSQALVAWGQNTIINGTIPFSDIYSFSSASWGGAIEIPFPTSISLSGVLPTSISLNNLGHALVSFMGTLPFSRSAAFASYYDGTAWSSGDTVAPLSPMDSTVFNPQIVLNDSNNGAAAWTYFNIGFGNSVIQAATFDGTNWTVNPDLSPPSEDEFGPTLAFNNLGNGVVVWDSNNNSVESSFLTAGSWGPSITVATGDVVDANSLPVVMNDNNAGIVAYDFNNTGGSGPDEVFASFFPATSPSSPPLPPAGISASALTNRFATQSDYIKIISWLASPTTDVTSYQISRNGTVIATVPSTQLSYDDHNQSKKTVNTYSVVALSATGASTPVTISE